jgi:hypothetical protein
MALIGICSPAIAQFVSHIVQLDGRDGAGIGIQDEEIQRELTDPIENGVGPSTTFEFQNLQELDLGQNDMLWQALHQASVQVPLALAKQMPLGFHGPRAGQRAVPGFRLLGPQAEYGRRDQRQEQPYIRSQMERIHRPIIA